MARDVADLTFASKTMINLAQDPASGLASKNILPIPWRDVELPRKLKIGYFFEMGGLKVSRRRSTLCAYPETSPACTRAVQDTVNALQKMGHDVEFFTPPDRELEFPSPVQYQC